MAAAGAIIGFGGTSRRLAPPPPLQSMRLRLKALSHCGTVVQTPAVETTRRPGGDCVSTESASRAVSTSSLAAVVRRIVHVSVETIAIVADLPHPFPEQEDQRSGERP